MRTPRRDWNHRPNRPGQPGQALCGARQYSQRISARSSIRARKLLRGTARTVGRRFELLLLVRKEPSVCDGDLLRVAHQRPQFLALRGRGLFTAVATRE